VRCRRCKAVVGRRYISVPESLRDLAYVPACVAARLLGRRRAVWPLPPTRVLPLTPRLPRRRSDLFCFHLADVCRRAAARARWHATAQAHHPRKR
jgi:hypothetical protein